MAKNNTAPADTKEENGQAEEPKLTREELVAELRALWADYAKADGPVQKAQQSLEKAKKERDKAASAMIAFMKKAGCGMTFFADGAEYVAVETKDRVFFRLRSGKEALRL